jgi:hypothetical protein
MTKEVERYNVSQKALPRSWEFNEPTGSSRF